MPDHHIRIRVVQTYLVPHHAVVYEVSMTRLALAASLVLLLAAPESADARRRRQRPDAAQPAGPVQTQGGLTAAQIRAVIQRHIGEVQACYERALVREPTLTGSVTVAFIITPAGTVGASTVATNTTGDSPVGVCIAEAVRGWRFPQPQPAGPVSVRFPFNLSTSGG